MKHDPRELAGKLKEIYPDIERHGLHLDLEFKPEKDYWVVKLDKGDLKLHTFLNQEDADACMEGIQCVYLGVQIGQFVENFHLLEQQ